MAEAEQQPGKRRGLFADVLTVYVAGFVQWICVLYRQLERNFVKCFYYLKKLLKAYFNVKRIVMRRFHIFALPL